MVEPILRFYRGVCRCLPKPTFIGLHYMYFICMTVSLSVIFYCISTPAWSVSYIDCLFLQVSAMTEAGLNTRNLSELNNAQQIILFLQIIAGSAIFVSMFAVNARKVAFNRTITKQYDFNSASSNPSITTAALQPIKRNNKSENVDVSCKTISSPPCRQMLALQHMSGTDDISLQTHTLKTITHLEKRNEVIGTGYPHLQHQDFLTRHVVGRNSQFRGLANDESKAVRILESQAINIMAWIVPIYFVLFQFLGCLGLGVWMACHARAVTESNGLNPYWVGAFNAVSAFNNSGMSLLDANMIPFQTSTYPVLTMGFLILAGNTAYPVLLRFILWCLHKMLPARPACQKLRSTLQFILDHPRRIYTNLFPSHATWWLLMTVVVLNATDWIFFEVLNIGNNIVESIPIDSRILDGLFQAVAVRSGGFYIVPIAQIRIGVQVLYVIMMYISVYPVAMTTRTSNVYEEESLGIVEDVRIRPPNSGSKLGTDSCENKYATIRIQQSIESKTYFLRHQIRAQLSHDLAYLVIAIFAITCIETSKFEADSTTYSVFNIMFEVVSGYGCVGLSTGLPDQAYSFSGGWSTASKLILCAVMLRGRHRGLPINLDRAVLISPDEDEEIQGHIGKDM